MSQHHPELALTWRYRTATRDKAIADCRSALFLTNPEVDRATLITAKGTRVSGTCEWIRKEPNYQQWLEGSIPLLWICGGPGKGKTMLSVFLVEELEQKKSVIYYFCTNEDERRNNASAVLRSLLWQITRIHPDLAQHFLTLLGAGEIDAASTTVASLSSVETLWVMFTTICRDPRVSQLAFILDGLDECDKNSRDWLASKLYGLRTDLDPQHTHPPKIMIVSREIPLLTLCSSIRLDPDHDGKIGKDVKSFVSERVQELWALARFDEKHRKDVESTLLERSEGTFLWIGFAITDLKTKRTLLEVERCLIDLPAGLPAFYGRMLEQIDTAHREDIAKVLQWTMLSARQLTISELAEAIHCKATRLHSAQEVVRDLVTICHPFLVVQPKAKVAEPHPLIGPLQPVVEPRRRALREKQTIADWQTVNLIHQSARDFMESSDMPVIFRLQREKGHFEMAWRCLDLIQESAREYLEKIEVYPSKRDKFSRKMSFTNTSPAFRNQRKEIHRKMEAEFSSSLQKFWQLKHPILGYAIVNWAAHARAASSLAKPLLKHPSGFFDEYFTVRSWWYYYYAACRCRPRELPNISETLNLSAYVGFIPWIEKIIDSRWLRIAALNDRPKWERKTPFEHAAEQGHGMAMQTLLEHGAIVNCSRRFYDRRYRPNPIDDFATSGNEMALRICIDHGVNVTTAETMSMVAPPLHLAAMQGHQAVVRLLLAAGADCEAKDCKNRTALMWAAERGYGAVVQVLLQFGAEVGPRDADGASAMHLAAEEPRYHIITMLSDWGASLDGATALRLAAIQGNETEVGLQLDRGVHVDATIPWGVTALYCAALEGHDNVVQLLINRGANIEAIAEASDFAGGKTVTHVITQTFKMDERSGRVVQLCCNAGADINAADDTGCTALILAVRGGWSSWHATPLIRALLDHGANIDAEDEDGLTALHHAAAQKRLEIAGVALLLANRAHINARDRRGRIPLHLAAASCRMDTKCIRLLLDNGADINARDNEGLTPLNHAYGERGVYNASVLIKLGAVEGRHITTLGALKRFVISTHSRFRRF
jgi:ankyrin repeat protein